MRRIPLALALVGAVAVTGCMGGGKTATSNDSGVQKGVSGSYFYVNVFTPPVGGIVESTPAGIKCGASALNVVGDQYAPAYYSGASACGQMQVAWGVAPAVASVTLTATPQGSNVFIGWAGDCSGTALTCTVTQGADKTVVAIFGPAGSGHGMPFVGHGAVFGQAAAGDTSVPNCMACHGADLKGLGMAPSCASCHASIDGVTGGGHGDAAAVAWSDDEGGGWSPTCQRCHTNGGYKDRIGVDGSPDYLGTMFASNPIPYYKYKTSITATQPTPPAGAGYANGPLMCSTCHNSVSDPYSAGITTVLFPSAVSNTDMTTVPPMGLGVVTTDKATALCAQCHQGRESTTSVNAVIAAQTPTVGADLLIAPVTWVDATTLTGGTSFKNPHYLGAAATVFGNAAKGWGEYPGKVYTGPNQHGVTAGKCTSCHDAHTQAIVPVSATSCGRCHFNEITGAPVASFAEIEESRQFGFEGDIDGDGVQESLKLEIQGLEQTLYAAIRAYAANTVRPICYNPNAHPYWFVDNGASPNDGICQEDEFVQYKEFTPRLFRATFNYKWLKADPGAWAHNPRYVIEIAYDAITDLNAGLGTTNAVPFSGFRTFAGGHFGAASAAAPQGSEAFHDWDPGPVSTACAQCHGGQKGIEKYLGLALPAAMPTNPTVASVTGFECTTCHAPNAGDTDMKTMRAVTTVYFPPQKAAAKSVGFAAATLFPKAGDRVCATCHTGRENGISVEDKITGQSPAGALNWNISFTNPHYLGAAGMMLGNDAKMMAQYAGKTYASKPVFWNSPYGSPHGQSCSSCHAAQNTRHSFEIDLATTVPGGTYHGATNTQTCKACHDAHVPNGLETVRTEYEERSAELLAAIQDYSNDGANFAAGVAVPVCYNGAAYPYWFKDTNADGVCDAAESVNANSTKFNPKASKAAFNYKWTQAEPGAWAHNEVYVFQVIFDTIEDLGYVPSFTRP